jgi:nicotinic acid mononucleotide adenylyltransferase
MSCILSKNGMAMFYIDKKRVSRDEFYKKYPKFSEENCKLSKEKQKLEKDILSLKSIKKDIEEGPLKSYKQQVEDYKKLLIEKEKKLIEYTDKFIREQTINLENLKKISDCEKQKQNLSLLKSDLQNLRSEYEKSIKIQNKYYQHIKKLEDEHESLSKKHNEILAKLSIAEENYQKEIKEFKESKDSKEYEQIKSDLVTCKSVNEKYSKTLEILKKEKGDLLSSQETLENKLDIVQQELSLSKIRQKEKKSSDENEIERLKKELELSKNREKEQKELISSKSYNENLLKETLDQIKTLRKDLSISKYREIELQKNLEESLKRENRDIYNNKIKEDKILEQELRIQTLLDEIKENTDILQIDIITKQNLEEQIKSLSDKLKMLSTEDELLKKKIKDEKEEFIRKETLLDENLKEANKVINDLIAENKRKKLEIELLQLSKKADEHDSKKDEEREKEEEEDEEDEEDEEEEEEEEEEGGYNLFNYLKQTQKNNPTQKVVLITTGSFNPVHKTHIRMATLASDKCNKDPDFVKKEGFIVAVVFSPSSDIYLKNKMRIAGNEKDAINQNKRLEMINLAIKDYEKENPKLNVKLFSDDWEMKNGNPDFDSVTQSLDQRIIKEKIPNIKVIYLCGADHLKNNIPPKSLLKQKYKAIGVNRYEKGKPIIDETERQSYNKAGNHYVVNFDMIDSIQYENYDQSASSTKVRNAAYESDKKTLKDLLFPSTLTYLITHNIFDLGIEKRKLKYFLKKQEDELWKETTDPTIIKALETYKLTGGGKDNVNIKIPHHLGGYFDAYFYINKDVKNAFYYIAKKDDNTRPRRDIIVDYEIPITSNMISYEPVLNTFIKNSDKSWFKMIYGFEEKNEDVYKIYDYDEKTQMLIDKKKPEYRFDIGKTSSPSIKELKEMLKTLNKFIDKYPIKYEVIVGNVINLHHDVKNNGSVFQAASQFNLLEMPSSEVSPDEGITDYILDKTQGPACAMSCPGAILYRNYFMRHDSSNIKDDGEFIGQLRGHQINMLKEIENYNKDKNYWHFENGYIMPHKDNIDGMSKLGEILKNDDMFELYKDMLRVGIQWNTQVWNTKIKVCQIYVSGIPISYMSDKFKNILLKDKIKKENFIYFCKFILYCAMEATILASIILSQERKERVKLYLTNVGCGVFGNNDEWLKKILIILLKEYKEYPLDVYMVIYEGIGKDKIEILKNVYDINDKMIK